nr:rhodanese-like domain-containing protein [Vagococcus entomophilus]
MNFLIVLGISIVVVALFYGGNEAILQIMRKRSAKWIEQKEFAETMRTAQVVDVREKNVFDAGHIMGARNFPYSMIKTSLASLRKDKPVYLYDQKKLLSIRVANRLRKEGYHDIYILKGGYEDWNGKIKKK